MLFSPKSFDTPCRIEVEHTNEHLHAHVELEGGVAIEPGDRVKVSGAPIRVAFGHRLVEYRVATVTRASALRRMLVQLRARFELTELYELSFSAGRAR